MNKITLLDGSQQVRIRVEYQKRYEFSDNESDEKQKKLDQVMPVETADPNRITAEDLAKKSAPNKTKNEGGGCCTLM